MPILASEPRAFPEDLLTSTEQWSADRTWRVAYTKVRQEKSLARDLNRREVPHYIPLVSKPHLYRGRRVDSFVPLFGSYVFLLCNEDERLRSLGTGRIAQMLPVKDPGQLEIDLHRIERLIDCGCPLTVEQRLIPGQRVRVMRGSLEGMEGVIEARKRPTRLVVAIEFLQQGVSLEIDDFLLEPI